MVSKTKPPVPDQASGEPLADRQAPPKMPPWQPEGPTLDFEDLLKVTRVGKSKAYELMKSDSYFPKGIPLYDTRHSRRFFWTHEAMAWLESRARKFHDREST